MMKPLLVTALLLLAHFGNCQHENPPKNVAILLFDGVQIIDYTAPFEILAFSFNIFTVAQKKDTITTWRGMKVIPTYGFEDCPEADIYIVPGGNTSVASKNPEILDWIKKSATNATVVMSVCNGTSFLARAGLLENQEATTTSNLIESLQKMVPSVRVKRDKRFVDNGKIITTGGYLSGVDGSLHIISRFFGSTWAAIIARRLEYNWDPESKFAAAALADCNVYTIYNKFLLEELNGEPITYSGDKEHWQSETIIKTHLTKDSLFSKLNEAIKATEKWNIKNSDHARLASTWEFVGKDYNRWTGEMKITNEKKRGDYRVDLAIKKK